MRNSSVLCIEPGWILAKLRQIVELILFALSSFALAFIVQRTAWAKAPVVRGRIGTAEAARRQKKDGHLKVAATRSEAKAAAGLPQSKRCRCASRRAAVMENASGTPIDTRSQHELHHFVMKSAV
jgi:hypothetical protein